VSYLREIAKRFDCKPMIIATNDAFLLFLSRNRKQLEDKFIVCLPEQNVVDMLIDKYEFYKVARKHNLAVPRTVDLSNADQYEQVLEEIKYPCLLKARTKMIAARSGRATSLIYDKSMLKKIFLEDKELCSGFVLQEIIEGEGANHISVAVYMDENSKLKNSFFARKIRQNNLGAGTFVESIAGNSHAETFIKFLEDIRYTGIAEIELKKDDKDGLYKVIEINPRPWLQISLARKCGLDFAWMYYSEACGIICEKKNNYFSGLKWMDLLGDFYLCFSKKGRKRRKMRELIAWIRQAFCVQVYSTFSLTDITPFVQDVFNYIKK
ncbi:hypothetical protein ACFLS1_10585, partial [Verrucomicrobiota bacterium]